MSMKMYADFATSTGRMANQKDIFPFSLSEYDQQTVHDADIIYWLRIAAWWWTSIVIRMRWIINVELSQVRGGSVPRYPAHPTLQGMARKTPVYDMNHGI